MRVVKYRGAHTENRIIREHVAGYTLYHEPNESPPWCFGILTSGGSICVHYNTEQ